MTDRLVSFSKREADAVEASIRPRSLAEFIGQEQARANLSVFIKAARDRNEPLDHVLVAGPPGLGKTTLAQILAKELAVNFRATSGPVIAKAGRSAASTTSSRRRRSGRGSMKRSLRIGCATRTRSHDIDEGAPITLVSQTLGHADLKTTSVYAHARPNDSSSRYLKRR